jgi:serine/threonine-protein kinase RsbW
MRTAIFPANPDQLDEIRKFASQAARDAGMDESAVYAVELCMDEACSNVIEHAYEGKNEGEIECTCDLNEKDLTIIIHDHGKSFNPANVPLPDLTADLDSRPIGGLGIFLMKKLMDEVRFESFGESGNVLTLIKHRKIESEKT